MEENQKDRQPFNFRLFKANEIECRINMVKESGISLLLYKNARVDQNLLDESVGPYNWSRSHQLIGDRLYCTVSIRNPETGEWVSKQDVGTESYTEKEKGQASDSFKRACFNWGIGRELYTAPFIWISKDACRIKALDDRGKKKYTCYERFHVQEIGYDSENAINRLLIGNEAKRTVYCMGKGTAEGSAGQPGPAAQFETDPNQVRVDSVHINTLYMEMKRTGIGLNSLLKNYKVSDIHELTIAQFKNAMEIFKAKPDKGPYPGTVPPDEEDPGLPWSTPER